MSKDYKRIRRKTGKDPLRVAICADHGGFNLKKKLLKFLEARGYLVADLGTHSAKSCDYPKIGSKVARGISFGEFERGILICKTGLGMSMVGNKFPNVRAALCQSVAQAVSSRQHNDANVIVFGANYTSFDKAREMLEAWFETPFLAGRHARRVEQIKDIEKKLGA